MKKARKVPALTDAQEARIQAGIARDPDSREASDEQLANMRPASEVLPPELYAGLVRPRGRPKAAETKVPVKLRLDRDAVAAFRESGPGWQTRLNGIIVLASKDITMHGVVTKEVSSGISRTKIAAKKKSRTKA